MDIQVLINTIQNNISSLHVGSVLAKESDLYTELGLSELYTANTKNTIKRYVQQYVTWEKTGTLNRAGNVSNQIIITKIIEDAENFVPEDGRVGNGGAHNLKYGKAFQGFLYYAFHNQNHVGPITAKEIVSGYYAFEIPEPEVIDSMKIDKELETSYSRLNLHKYYDALYQFLRQATSSALESLSKAGYIRYSYDKYIDKIPSWIDIDTLEAITPRTKLLEFIRAGLLGEGVSVNELQEKLNQRTKKNNEPYFDLNEITLMEYVNRCARKHNQFDTTSLIRGVCVKNPNVKPSRELIDNQSSTPQFMQSIEDAIKTTFFESGEIKTRKKWKEFSKYCGYIYELLGWKKVFLAYNILPIKSETNEERARTEFKDSMLLDDIKKYEAESINFTDDYKKYVNGLLASASEKSFGTIIANMHANEAERNANRRGLHLDGNSHPASGTMPEHNEYYMANDLLINREHARVFDVWDVDEYHLKKYIRPLEDLLLQ